MRRRPRQDHAVKALLDAVAARSKPLPGEDPSTRQRTAVTCAAFLLAEAGEWQLVSWLIGARPEAMAAVASGVAAIALRMGCTAVWDILAAVDAFNLDDAIELFEVEGMLEWGPSPDQLDELTPATFQLA